MRKHKIVRIESEGRDKGKHFLIVEMPAMQSEKWSMRLLLALRKAGVEVPDDAIQAGAAGVMAAGLSLIGTVSFADLEPLLDEMLQCVSFVGDPSKVDQVTRRPIARPLIMGDEFNDGDIEELGTLLKLRGEVAEIHMGFSVTAMLSASVEAWKNSRQSPSQTSRKPAARSSRRVKQR